jgi:hypothetical protein
MVELPRRVQDLIAGVYSGMLGTLEYAHRLIAGSK